MLRGTMGLELGYALMLAAVFSGMIRANASWERLILSPVVAIGLTLMSGLLLALVHSLSGIIEVVFGVTVILGMGYMSGLKLAQQDGVLLRRGTTVLQQKLETGGLGQLLRDCLNAVSQRKRPGAAQKGEQSPVSEPSGLTLAGVPLSRQDITKHFKLIGTTGTGKSTAIRELLDGALARGDRAIIADPDGGYLGRYYDPARGDVILNPFMLASHRWDLHAEIFQEQDVAHVARALLADRAGSDGPWYEYARSFFAWAVRQTMRDGIRDLKEIVRLVKSAPLGELREILAGQEEAHFVAEGNERMFGSVRSVTAIAVSALEHIAQQEGPGFSVRKWICDGRAGTSARDGGVLFMPYRSTEVATLGGMISTWLRLAIFEAMAQPEGDQRLWIVIDELDALGPIDGLKDALARLRKFGAACVLGFQSISQVWGTYGRAHGDTIIENTGTTLILRCSASDGGGTAKYASTLIGEQQVSRETKSRSQSGILSETRSRSEHISIEPAVLASEIEQLPDLHGYLKVATKPQWSYVELTMREPLPGRSSAHYSQAPQAGPAPAPPGQVPDTRGPRRRRSARAAASANGHQPSGKGRPKD